MYRGKVKKFLAGLLCAAMLVGNWGSATAFAATEPVFEETAPEETVPVFEETAPEETEPVFEETAPEGTEPVFEETADLPEADAPDESSETSELTENSDAGMPSVQSDSDGDYRWNNLEIVPKCTLALLKYNVGYYDSFYSVIYTKDPEADFGGEKEELTSAEYEELFKSSDLSYNSVLYYDVRTISSESMNNGFWNVTRELRNLEPNTTYYAKVVGSTYDGNTRYLFLTDRVEFTTKEEPETSQLSIARFEVKESGFAAAEVSLVINNPEGEDYAVELLDENDEKIGWIGRSYPYDEQLEPGQELWTAEPLEFSDKDSLQVKAQIKKGDESIVGISDSLTVTRKSGLKADVQTKVTGSTVAFSLRQTPYYEVDNNKIKVILRYQSENGGSEAKYIQNFIYNGTWDQTLTGLEENQKYNWMLTCEKGSTTLFTKTGTFTTGGVVTYTEKDFPDEALLDAIKKELGENTPLTNVNLAGIRYLQCVAGDSDAGGGVIKDLEGIQYLTGLQSLIIMGHDITSADQVSELTGLTYLNLESNDLRTMPDLSKNTELTTIYLSGNLLPAEEITAEKLPASFREKNPDWINGTRDNQRPEFSAVTAEEYYATGNGTWPFIAKFFGLKRSQEYTLTATIGEEEYTKKEYLTPWPSGNLMIIQGITGINAGQKTVACKLTGADGVIYWDETVTCSFTESAGGGKKNYLKGTETYFYCTVQLDQTKAAKLGENVRLYLESSDGERVVGASADDIESYSQKTDDRYQGVFGGDYLDTGYTATVYYGEVRLANYLEAGSYHVRIVGETGAEELLEDVVEVSAVSVVTSVSPYSEIDNTGEYVYVQVYGKNLDPDKVKIRLMAERGAEIAEFAGVLQKGSDSMVYKYKKKAEFWDAGGMSARWALEDGDCLDAGTYHYLYFSGQALLLLHYNYKKGVVEAKLSSEVEEGTEVTLTISDQDLQYNNNTRINGSGTGTVKNHWLQVKLTDSEGNEYIPPVSQYGNYVYTKLEYGDRKEYQHIGISWYNYTGSGTVSGSTDGMSVMPIRTGDTTFSVNGHTTKLSAGEKAEVKLFSNGTMVESWSVLIGSGGSFKGECNMESPLPEGSYALRLTAAGEEAALLSNSLFVYEIDKFYIDNQWGSYDKTKNSISVSLSSRQIYAEQCRTDGVNFSNISNYTVEVYDRLGNEIETATLRKITAPAKSNVVYLTLGLPTGLQKKNYTGFYVKIRWSGKDGYLTSNPKTLYYASGSWSCDPKYGSWTEAAGAVGYYFQENTTTSHGYYGVYCTNTQTSTADRPLTVKVYEAQTEELKASIAIKSFDTNGMYRFTDANLKDLDKSTVYNLELVTKSGDTVARETGYIVRESSTSTPTYTVSFDLQGHGSGTAYAEKTVEKDKTVPKPTDPKENGWTFGGWYKDAGCTEIWDFSADKVTADMTLYAKWERDTKNYCFVTFDTNGAESPAPAMQAVLKGKTAAEPEAPVKADAVFTGWYTDAGCTAEKRWEFSTGKVTADMTLYAGWMAPIEMGKVETPKAHILNYDGGEVETGTKVFLTTGTNGAKIYYTTDGSVPTRASALYTDAIVISGEMLNGRELKIRAFAVMDSDKTGRKYEDSDIMDAVYAVKDESQDWGDVTGNDLGEEGDAASITKGLWVAGIPESTPYTGKKITFGVRVYDHKKLLTEKKDYTVTYKDNQNVARDKGGEPDAKATVTITGKGNYSGSIVKKFIIMPLDISGEDFTADDILLAHTGNVQKATPTLRWKGTALKKDTAFKVSYPDTDPDTGAYKEADDWTITLTGKGNFTGERSVTESIVTAKLISKVSIGKIGNQKYTGEPITPALTVKSGNKNLEEGDDYSLEWENNTDVGTAKVTITGEGDYTGTVTKTFKITGTALNASKLKNFAASMPYTGEAREQSENVTFDYGTKTEPKLLQGMPAEGYDAENPDRSCDYTIAYQNNTEIGTATVIYTGINGYTGTVKKTFKITGNTFSADTVKIEGFQNGAKGTLPYTGEEVLQECTLTLKADNTALEEGTHYSVSYTKNTDAGTATVTYKGINAYTGTIKKTYKIAAYNWTEDAAGDKRITVSMDDAAYAKDGVNPAPTVTYTYNGESRQLVSGKDYKISYSNNKAVKELTAGDKKNPALTLTGKGNFAGTYKVEFSIKQQNLKNLEERIAVQDVKYQNKANIYKSAPTVTDLNGKKLKSGTDYTVSYTYAEPVFVSQTGSKTAVTLRGKDAPVEDKDKDIIPVGAVLQVTVTGKGNYTGSAAATFRFVKENLSGASVKVADQYYSGRAAEPGKDQMTVKIGKTVLSKEDYEITDYTNNVKKGTAKVTLRGLGNYGGTKTVTFKIKDRTMGYTIVFDGNGATGGSMANQLIASTAGKKLTANKFKKTGYDFVGWATEQEPGDEPDDEPDDEPGGEPDVMRYANKALFPGQKGEYTSGSTVVLYAQWKPTRYIITYDLGGKGTLPSKVEEPELYYYTIEDGFDLSSVTPESKTDDYYFDGWYTDSGRKNRVEYIEEGTTGKKTFYAKWVKEE